LINLGNKAFLGKNASVENNENQGSHFLLTPGQKTLFAEQLFSFVANTWVKVQLFNEKQV